MFAATKNDWEGRGRRVEVPWLYKWFKINFQFIVEHPQFVRVSI
jgi:hypothetical protein